MLARVNSSGLVPSTAAISRKLAILSSGNVMISFFNGISLLIIFDHKMFNIIT